MFIFVFTLKIIDNMSRINSGKTYSFPTFQFLSANYREYFPTTSLGVHIIYMRVKQCYFTVIEYENDLSSHTIRFVRNSMYVISNKFYSILKGQMILIDNHMDLDPLN